MMKGVRNVYRDRRLWKLRGATTRLDESKPVSFQKIDKHYSRDGTEKENDSRAAHQNFANDRKKFW